MPSQSVRQHLTDTLKDRQTVLVLINICVTVVFVAALYRFVDQRILWPWVAFQLLLHSARLYVFWRIRSRSMHQDWQDGLVTPFSVLAGLGWGCSAFLLPDSTNIIVVIAIPIVLTGMCSGAVVALSAVPIAFYGFLVSVALPYIFVQITQFNEWTPLFIGLAITYVSGIGLMGRQAHGMLADSMALGYENRDLVQKLDGARQALELKVATQESELDALLATVPAFICVVHEHDKKAPKISRFTTERLQLSQSGRPKKSFAVMSHGEVLPKHDWPLVRAMRGEIVEDCELRLCFDDGSHIDEIINAVPMRDATGAVIGAVGAGIDITSRKRIEDELRRSEARFRDFARSASDWLWETDADHRFIWMSENVEERTGVPAIWHYHKTRFELRQANTDVELWQNHRKTLDAQLPFRDLEYLRRGPNGDQWLSASGIPIFDDNGSFRGYRGVGRDITDHKNAEQKAWFLANHDPLTDLPNRRLLHERLDALRTQATSLGKHVALAFVDVDRFKHVNDTLGHQAGDRFLVEIGRRLNQCVADRGMVARFGGDEFAVAIGPVADVGDAKSVADMMLDAMRLPLQATDSLVVPTISIGAALFPDDADDGELLMRNADRALYRAKENGRNRVCFYDAELDHVIHQ